MNVSGIKQMKHSLLIIKIYGCPGFQANTDYSQLDSTAHIYGKDSHQHPSLLSLLPLLNFAVVNWANGG